MALSIKYVVSIPELSVAIKDKTSCVTLMHSEKNKTINSIINYPVSCERAQVPPLIVTPPPHPQLSAGLDSHLILSYDIVTKMYKRRKRKFSNYRIYETIV